MDYCFTAGPRIIPFQMRKFQTITLLITLLLAAPEARAGSVVLTATSPWSLSHDEEVCSLSRTFGVNEDKVVLDLQKNGPSINFRPSIYGKPVKPFVASAENLFAGFGPPDKLFAIPDAFMGSYGGDKQPLVIFGFSFSLLNRYLNKGETVGDALGSLSEQLSAIRQFRATKGDTELILQTGPIAKPMAAVDACASNLVKGWGLDPEEIAKSTVRPKPQNNPGEWLTAADFPKGADWKGKSANLRYRVMVNSAGAATTCKIQFATGSPNFNDLTCSLLVSRAKFFPGLNAQGNPMDSYYVGFVRWRD